MANVEALVVAGGGGGGGSPHAAGAGVTINAPASVALEIGEQYSSRGLLKTATDTWLLI